LGVGAIALAPLAFVAGGHQDYIVPKSLLLDAGAVLLAVGYARRRPRLGRDIGWLSACFVVALGATLLHLPFAHHPPLVLDTLASLGRWMLLFLGGVWLGERSDSTLLCAAAICAGALASSAIGALQVSAPDLLPLAQREGIGLTFLHPNLAAQYLLVAIFPTLFLCLAIQRRGLRRAAWIALAVELAVLLLLGRRGAWLGAIAGASVVTWKLARSVAGRRRMLGAAALAAAVLALTVTGVERADLADPVTRIGKALDPGDGAYRFRGRLLEASLSMLRERPWSGVGPGHWGVQAAAHAPPPERPIYFTWSPATTRVEHAHNDGLELLAEYGLPLGLALIAGFAAALWRLQRTLVRARRTGDSVGATWRVVLPAAWLAMAVNACFNFPFASETASGMLWLMTGLAAGAVGATRIGDARSIGPRAAGAALLASLALLVLARDRTRWIYSERMAEGATLHHEGRVDEARPALVEARRVRPGEVGGHYYLAELELVAGRPERAAEVLEEGLAIHPHQLDLWHLRARISTALAKAARQAEQAERLAREALRGTRVSLSLYPFHPRVLALDAELRLALGDSAGAHRSLETLLGCDPLSSDGWRLLDRLVDPIDSPRRPRERPTDQARVGNALLVRSVHANGVQVAGVGDECQPLAVGRPARRGRERRASAAAAGQPLLARAVGTYDVEPVVRAEEGDPAPVRRERGRGRRAGCDASNVGAFPVHDEELAHRPGADVAVGDENDVVAVRRPGGGVVVPGAVGQIPGGGAADLGDEDVEREGDRAIGVEEQLVTGG